MADDNFEIPPDWIGTPVQVFTKTPIPAKTSTGEVTITFPSFIGTLKQDLHGALLLNVTQAQSEPQDILYPKANIQQILRASDITVVPGSAIAALMQQAGKPTMR